jgi:glycosyltransferase involved in cell wall biosynthesis
MPSSAPLVSVITPVYNGADYLEECIRSVLAQTYGNWTYTIVDNRSTDRSREIADAFASRDPRIRVLDTDTFLSAIASQEFALRQASPGAVYTKVVFADDWLFRDCIEEMVALAEAHPNVGLVSAYGLYGTRVVWDGLPPSVGVVEGREISRSRLLGGPYVFGTLTSVLVRSALLGEIRAFRDHSNLQADTEACFELMQRADFGFVHKILTFTRSENESTNTAAVRLATRYPATLSDLLKFGPSCLTAEELERRVEEHLDDYYRFLAGEAFHRRGADFWIFHADRMRKAGRPLSRARVARGMAAQILDWLLNPKRTAERLVEVISKGR